MMLQALKRNLATLKLLYVPPGILMGMGFQTFRPCLGKWETLNIAIACPQKTLVVQVTR